MILIFTMQLEMLILLGKKLRSEKLLKNEIHLDGNQSLPVLLLSIRLINSLICISFGKNNMSKKKEKFNGMQGMNLLLLKKLSLLANVVFLRFSLLLIQSTRLVMRMSRYKKTCPKAGLFEDQSQVIPYYNFLIIKIRACVVQ